MASSAAQIASITAMNLRNLSQRWASSLVAVVGVAGVTLVLVSVLSIAEGFRAAMDLAGSDDVAIALRAGSTDEMTSGVPQEAARVISDAAQVARGSDQRPIVSPELYVVVDAVLRGKGSAANLPLRGVGPLAPQIRKRFRIEEGRMFAAGSNEIIIGTGAAQQFEGLGVGQSVRWGSGTWTVVGRFSERGGISESEAWGDARVIAQAYNRGTTYQSVRALLSSAAAFDDFKDVLSADPRVNVRIERERDFYAEQSKFLRTLVTTAGWTLALMMGFGAVFAALNTMSIAVDGRTREIATLRALGFGAAPVVVSVMAESLLLGSLGGLLGGAIAYVAFDGLRSSTLNWQNFSQVTFAFTVTPSLVFTGIAYGLVLTLLGGLMPAIRGARLPIAAGLRES